MIRFIHAADIHLDSPLRGLDAYEGAPTDTIRGASRRSFANLVQLAMSHDNPVDFVILAGDLYDGNWPDYNTGLFFINQVRQLEQANIPVILLQGNHDAESRITSRLTLPSNVHVLPTDRPGTILLDRFRVAVHGQGYARPAELRNLAANYPAPVAGHFNIGVLHTALEGREGHDPYAPCTLAELLARDYDYWALGHIHHRESVNGNGRVRVEFPGNLQGRHVGEAGAKGCLLVTVDESGNVRPEFQATDVLRWEVILVDGGEADSSGSLLDAALARVEDARCNAEGRTLALRIRVACRKAVHQKVTGNREQFRFDVAAQAGTGVWIEKVQIELDGQLPEPEAVLDEDAFSELRTVLAEWRSQPQAAHELFADGNCGKLQKLLPAEVRNVISENFENIFAYAETTITTDNSGGDP